MKTLPEHFLPAVDYGFPADELARIKSDYPHVDVVFDAISGEQSVVAWGDSGSVYWLLADLRPGDVYKLHEWLHDMAKAARDRKPIDVVRNWKTEAEQRERNERESVLAELDPEKSSYVFSRQLGFGSVQVSVPAGAF